MPLHIPSNLKSADITRFALRAAQLEKAKPVIAYWCYYWIVKQIISKGLHHTDRESMDFTTGLMDKLEQIKAENIGNDAIADDMAAQAYVEVFASDVFQRADNAVRADKVSKQTADTFLAAATFLDLLQIWADPDPELAAKSKYAKYHALRITKALKAGLDPNASNPKAEVPPQQAEEPEPRDPDYQWVEDVTGIGSHSSLAREPFVEDMPEDVNTKGADMPTVSAHDEHLQPPVLPLAPQEPSFVPHTVSAPGPEHMNASAFYRDPRMNDDMVSPAEPSPADANFGSSFPGAPDFMPRSNVASNSAGSPTQPTGPAVSSRPGSSGMPGYSNSNGIDSHDPHRNAFAGQETRYPINVPPSQLPPSFSTHPYPSPQPLVPPSQHSRVAPAAFPAAPDTGQTGAGDDYIVDEQAISQATKHAKWAISALNFEDVKTAVKELKGALESLGVRQ